MPWALSPSLPPSRLPGGGDPRVLPHPLSARASPATLQGQLQPASAWRPPCTPIQAGRWDLGKLQTVMLCGVPSPAWPPARPPPPPPGGGARLRAAFCQTRGALIGGFGTLQLGTWTAGLGFGSLFLATPPKLTESFPLFICPCTPRVCGSKVNAVPCWRFNELGHQDKCIISHLYTSCSCP